MITLKRYIVKSWEGQYLTPRRSTGRMYENRSGWSDDPEDARIFQTLSAARTASNSVKGNKEVVEVAVILP